MPTLLIYAPIERGRAQLFGAKLEKFGRVVLYAPLGYPLMSPDWKRIVETNVEAAEGSIVLLSKLSLEDESVLYRVDLVNRKSGSTIIPLCFEHLDPNLILSSPIKHLLGWLQMGIVDGADSLDEWAARCHSFLPRERPRCFLSYSSHDVDLAKAICSRLQESKVDVWRDQTSIELGTEWDRQIESGIKRSTHFLVVHTANAANSENVRDELSFARENGKVIIPLLFDETKLPLRIHRAQAVDMRKSIDEGIGRLIALLAT